MAASTPRIPPRTDFSDQSEKIDEFTKNTHGDGIPPWAKLLGGVLIGVPLLAVLSLAVVGIVAACWKGITFLADWAF